MYRVFFKWSDESSERVEPCYTFEHAIQYAKNLQGIHLISGANIEYTRISRI